MTSSKIELLIDSEREQLEKMSRLLENAIDEKSLSDTACDPEKENLSVGSKMADFVARVGGSWKFIIWFTFFLATWIVVNVFFLQHAFDHYPFILLNLILSTIAAVQAPIIMMSQNRKEEKDRRRAINDYIINLKAELEVRNLNEKLDLVMTEQMKALFQIQEAQFKLMEDIKEMIHRQEQDHSRSSSPPGCGPKVEKQSIHSRTLVGL